MRIRPADQTDVDGIAQIHRTARAAAMPWLPVVHSATEDIAYFRDRVLPSETVLVAETEDAMLGFVAFVGNWLNHLYIAPSSFRRGIGSQLLGMAQAKSDELQLWTFQGNATARAFYAKHGFRDVEFTDGQNNEEQTPDVRLIWRRD